jgi:DNA mismatch repair protein MutS2
MISPQELALLDWNEVLGLFTSRCSSEMTRKLYDNLSSLERDGAQLQSRKISELKNGIINQISPDISSLFPVREQLMRAQKEGILSLDEIYQCMRTIECTNNILRFFKTHSEEFPFTSYDGSSIIPLFHEEKLLTESVTADVALNVARYPHIGKLQNEISSLQSEVQKRLQNLVNSGKYRDHIQEKTITSRSNRYLILLKASSKGSVDGSIFDTSGSGQTFYFEPSEIRDLNSKIIERESTLSYELFLILQNLSHTIGSVADDVLHNMQKALYIDFLKSAALVSHHYSWSECEYSKKSELRLLGAKHPILAAENPGTTVANSVDLSETRGLIITGANTGGKTVLLKSIALAVTLGRMGLHIPAAPDSVIGDFKRVFVDLGDDQNITKSLSTFSGQIVAIKNMMERVNRDSLVIIDEIISGTNPRHAAALGIAVLDEFAKRKATVVVSSHYPELKEFANSDTYYENASVSFDLESLRPTYRLLMGTPGTSYAFEIAKIYGLGDTLLDEAKARLSENEIVSDKTIEKINAMEVELEQKRVKAIEQERALEKQRENYAALNEKLRNRIAHLKEDRTIDYIKELESRKEKILSEINAKQQPDEKDLHRLNEAVNDEIQDSYQRLEKLKEGRLSKEITSLGIENAEPGDEVFILSLEKNGTILEINQSKQEVLVSLGSAFKSRFPFSKIKLIEKGAKIQLKQISTGGKKKNSGNKEDKNVPTMQTAFNTIDLRGMRVDEALLKLDYDMDSKVKQGLEAVVVIHGHGTGALKTAVREWLRNSYYIQSYRPGEQSEGGDGVSIVYL